MRNVGSNVKNGGLVKSGDLAITMKHDYFMEFHGIEWGYKSIKTTCKSKIHVYYMCLSLIAHFKCVYIYMI